jgi:hypothetical protein
MNTYSELGERKYRNIKTGEIVTKIDKPANLPVATLPQPVRKGIRKAGTSIGGIRGRTFDRFCGLRNGKQNDDFLNQLLDPLDGCKMSNQEREDYEFLKAKAARQKRNEKKGTLENFNSPD